MDIESQFPSDCEYRTPPHDYGEVRVGTIPLSF
jgi:hypothetical protein